jgi:hypothetical protein
LRVSSLTPARPFNANDTAPFDTPAWRATSAMVGRRAVIGDLPKPVYNAQDKPVY